MLLVLEVRLQIGNDRLSPLVDVEFIWNGGSGIQRRRNLGSDIISLSPGADHAFCFFVGDSSRGAWADRLVAMLHLSNAPQL
jgi:hypothetical protein